MGKITGRKEAILLVMIVVLLLATLAAGVNGRTRIINVSTSVSELCPVDISRSAVTIYNSSAGILYIGIGNAAVNSSTGFPLPAASGITLDAGGQKAALYAITASGTATVGVAEEWQ